MPKTVLAIVGPTASGKTALALEYAARFDGEIISCDSVQIYKYLNIGSAKPSLEELNRVPHHLIDKLEPTEIYNAGIWRNNALICVEDILSKGKLPIIVGGTGLYLKSLYQGMFEGNSRNQEIRQNLEQRVLQEGLETLFLELKHKDFIYAQKISCQDQLRIIRALEAMEVTGKLFSELHQNNFKPNWKWHFLIPPIERSVLYSQIESRVDCMIKQGLIEETQDLIQRFKQFPALNSIGYKHAYQYLTNILSKEKMIELLKRDTRHFAKRQISLFGSMLKNIDTNTEFRR